MTAICPYCYEPGVHATAAACRHALDWALDGPAIVARLTRGREAARRQARRVRLGYQPLAPRRRP